MISFLTWIEQSALGHFMRESGPWTYPLVNLAHILGIASLFGAVLVVDLTLLGVGGRRPPAVLAGIVGAARPIALAGFMIAAATGIGLLASNGSEYAGNPFLLIKFPAIGLGLLNAALVERSATWRALRAGQSSPSDARRLTVIAATSLTCWVAAIGAGRLIGYW